MKMLPVSRSTIPYGTPQAPRPIARPSVNAPSTSTLPERLHALKQQIDLLQSLRGVRLSGNHTYPIQMPLAGPKNSPATSHQRSSSLDSMSTIPHDDFDVSHLSVPELIERTAGLTLPEITAQFVRNVMTFAQVGKADVCCADETQEAGVRAEKKSQPITNKLTKEALNEFHRSISQLAEENAATKSAGYIKDIAKYTEQIHSRMESKDNPTDHHDLSIMVSEVLADVTGKMMKHCDQPETNALATKVLQALLNEKFSNHFNQSEFRYLLFRDGSSDLISADKLLNKIRIHTQLIDEIYTPREHSMTTPDKKIVYQEAANITMRMKKPDSSPTWMGGFERVDRHYHNHPYDNYSEHSKFSPLRWEETMTKRLNISHTDIMPIPHQISKNMLRPEVLPRHLNHPASHAYYADPNAGTEFFGHDATMIRHHNDLQSRESRARFNICATGLPVDINRVDEAGEIAKEFALNATLAQLQEGRKHIAVNFGEITGYKPALPQKLLTENERKPSIMQDKFISGSAKILTKIFQKSQEGIALALQIYKTQPGASLEGVHTKTRITYHADALPTQDAVVRDENRKNDGSRKEAIRVCDIVAYARQIDKNLTPQDDFPEGGVVMDKNLSARMKLPEGVVHEHHLQSAHLMGASIESNNFTDPSRATELHKAFRTLRAECKNLRVTTDASWLTASARAINHGMAHFFSEAKDNDLNEIGELITLADDLSNDSFMFLHAGERHFESSLLKGDDTGDTLMNMAVMRAAQKKAVRTYHATLGALHDKINTESVLEKVESYIKTGYDSRGLVHAGNYPGLFLQLAKEGAGSKQDKTPIVWGTDNLTASNARSGDLKLLQYTSQHGPLEIILYHLGDSARTPLRDFLSGTKSDREYLGAETRVDPGRIGDGKFPLHEMKKKPSKSHHQSWLYYVNAPKDMIMPFSASKERKLSDTQEKSASAGASTVGGDSRAGHWVLKGVNWVRES